MVTPGNVDLQRLVRRITNWRARPNEALALQWQLYKHAI
jgi:hypothetical protein